MNRILRARQAISVLAVVLSCCGSSSALAAGPVIDVHLHAGPGNPHSRHYTVGAQETPTEAWIRTLLQQMDAHEVVLGIIGGPPAAVEQFRRAAPDRFVAGIVLPCTEGMSPNLYRCYEDGGDWPALDSLKAEVESGRVGALGELYNVYAGISPLDPRMEPYFALAAQHDLLVLAHADLGPPPQGRVPGCCPNFEGAYGNPALYAGVLARHPDLRLILYHVFRPEFVQAAIELMDAYPNVMVETSPMHAVPTPLVHAALQRFVEAGHGDRIVFGSDYLGTIGPSLEVVESAPLSAEQKRAILYDNAARFLRLSPETIRKHYGN